MLDVLDYDLQKNDPEPPQRGSGGGRPRAGLIVGAVVLLVIAIAVGLRWSRPAPPAATAAPVTAYRPAAETAKNNAPAMNIPPLDQSDAAVRALIGALSSHPKIAAWLATPNLIRTMAVVVDNIESGATPARHLRVLRPTGPFMVTDVARPTIDPASYRRFDSIADAVASVDTAGAAALYAGLRPRLDEAYKELGREGSFDAAVERAIVALMQVPVVQREVPLQLGQGARYLYAEPQLQEMTAAQQQLFRMGPRNIRIIQGKLQAFRDAALE